MEPKSGRKMSVMKPSKTALLKGALLLATTALVSTGAVVAAHAFSLQEDVTPQLVDAETLSKEVRREAVTLENLRYPDEFAEKAAVSRLSRLTLGENTVWEAGIAGNIVLDNWECTWLEHANAAQAEGNLEELARAGQEIMTRAEIPGQREELFPDVDQFLQRVIAPMIAGVWEPAGEHYESFCGAYLESGATR